MTETLPLKLALVGASGRMGRTLLATLREAEYAPPYWELVGAHASPAREVDGISCITDRDEAFSGADVVIDFSHPSQTAETLEAAARAGAACLICTTPFPPEAHAAFQAASEKVAVMHAPNTSVTVSVLAKLVAKAVSDLDDSFDIEILDFHHAAKIDAPSGTAHLLAGVARSERYEKELARKLARDKEDFYSTLLPEAESRCDQQGPRTPGTIGIASLRGGTTVSEHRVIFAGQGERLELHHIAQDRTAYARGALLFARMLSAAPPKIYLESTLTAFTKNGPYTPLFTIPPRK